MCDKWGLIAVSVACFDVHVCPPLLYEYACRSRMFCVSLMDAYYCCRASKLSFVSPYSVVMPTSIPSSSGFIAMVPVCVFLFTCTIHIHTCVSILVVILGGRSTTIILLQCFYLFARGTLFVLLRLSRTSIYFCFFCLVGSAVQMLLYIQRRHVLTNRAWVAAQARESPARYPVTTRKVS